MPTSVVPRECQTFANTSSLRSSELTRLEAYPDLRGLRKVRNEGTFSYSRYSHDSNNNILRSVKKTELVPGFATGGVPNNLRQYWVGIH